MGSKNKSNKFPSEKILKEIREKYSDSNFDGGHWVVADDASVADHTKYQLCQYIIRYLRENELSQRDVAAKLGINEARISEIVRGRIDHFTVDRLIDYATQLYPDIKVEISAA